MNPFMPSFGVIPKLRVGDQDVISRYVFNLNLGDPMYQTRMIYGVRGSGKTVLLRSIEEQVESMDDWIVVRLNLEVQDSLMSQLVTSLSRQMGFSLRNFLTKFKSINVPGIGGGASWDNSESNSTVMMAEDLLKTLRKQNKHLLVTLDEVYSTDSLKEFTSQYQIWIGTGLPINLLLTGIPSQIDTLKNEKGMTFLWRTPRLVLDQIGHQAVLNEYRKVFDGIDPLAVEQMAQLVERYAFAFQVVGYVIWNKAKGNGSSIDVQTINECLPAIKELLFNQSYIKIYQELTPQQQQFLQMISRLPNRVMKIGDLVDNFKVGKNLQTRRSTVNRLRHELINDQILRSPAHGQVELALPFFKDFLLAVDEY